MDNVGHLANGRGQEEGGAQSSIATVEDTAFYGFLLRPRNFHFRAWDDYSRNLSLHEKNSQAENISLKVVFSISPKQTMLRSSVVCPKDL